jgi:fimbrial chaperone protein
MRGLRRLMLASLLAAAAPAVAGSFSITPIRVELGAAHPHGVLTLHNDSDSPVTVQVSAVSWSQPGGQDHYESTHDLITTPPVFVIAANADQIIRVALRRDLDPTRELAYRLFFQEVPQATNHAFSGLQVSLRIGVPVFVAPTGAAPAAQLVWQAHGGGGTMEIQAANRGTAHLQVIDFDLLVGSQATPVHVKGARYVLPDNAVSWSVKLPPGIDQNAPLHIHALSDHGEISADVNRPVS